MVESESSLDDEDIHGSENNSEDGTADVDRAASNGSSHSTDIDDDDIQQQEDKSRSKCCKIAEQVPRKWVKKDTPGYVAEKFNLADASTILSRQNLS